MKLLFDQNLSPSLPARLADVFPGSAHVQDFGLDRVEDDELWDYAKRNGFAVVTKDEDFNTLSILRGHPPKVLWLQLGNCTTSRVESSIRLQLSMLSAFETDPSVGTFLLY